MRRELKHAGMENTLLISLNLKELYCGLSVCGHQVHFVKAAVIIWTIAIVLFVLWLLGFAVFHVAGGLIHLLLVFAVIAIVYQFITGRRVV